MVLQWRVRGEGSRGDLGSLLLSSPLLAKFGVVQNWPTDTNPAVQSQSLTLVGSLRA